MNQTMGILFILAAAAILVIAISNFVPQFGAATTVAERQQDYKLMTTTTDLRFDMGVQFLVQILVTGVLVLLGWFLYAAETPQTGYAIVVGVLLLAMIIIRVTPLVPWAAVKLSPGTLFYAAQVRLPVSDDATRWYVTLPVDSNFRIGVIDAEASEGKGVALLDFGADATLRAQYDSAYRSTMILGSVTGTATIARQDQKTHIFMIPRIKVAGLEKPG
ncbi:MAG: hypothetical protein GX100_06315 [candidate division WS1 bacterium]|jgi:hypothetical protein|nr:hypothetical protein [candidate division WS1 bacterium]